MLQPAVNFKWDAGWKRLNHDRYIVIGFLYGHLFLLLPALPGRLIQRRHLSSNPPAKSNRAAEIARKRGCPAHYVRSSLRGSKTANAECRLYQRSAPRKPIWRFFTVTVMPPPPSTNGLRTVIGPIPTRRKLGHQLSFGDKTWGSACSTFTRTCRLIMVYRAE